MFERLSDKLPKIRAMAVRALVPLFTDNVDEELRRLVVSRLQDVSVEVRISVLRNYPWDGQHYLQEYVMMS